MLKTKKTFFWRWISMSCRCRRCAVQTMWCALLCLALPSFGTCIALARIRSPFDSSSSVARAVYRVYGATHLLLLCVRSTNLNSMRFYSKLNFITLQFSLCTLLTLLNFTQMLAKMFTLDLFLWFLSMNFYLKIYGFLFKN